MDKFDQITYNEYVGIPDSISSAVAGAIAGELTYKEMKLLKTALNQANREELFRELFKNHFSFKVPTWSRLSPK